MIGKFCITLAYSSIYIISGEIFPTTVRYRLFCLSKQEQGTEYILTLRWKGNNHSGHFRVSFCGYMLTLPHYKIICHDIIPIGLNVILEDQIHIYNNENHDRPYLVVIHLSSSPYRVNRWRASYYYFPQLMLSFYLYSANIHWEIWCRFHQVLLVPLLEATGTYTDMLTCMCVCMCHIGCDVNKIPFKTSIPTFNRMPDCHHGLVEVV